jgi:hypothetical protein
MFYLIDDYPNHCPQCGADKAPAASTYQDFMAGAAMVCKCGAQWQYLPTDQIKAASRLTSGDLANYMEHDGY